MKKRKKKDEIIVINSFPDLISYLRNMLMKETNKFEDEVEDLLEIFVSFTNTLISARAEVFLIENGINKLGSIHYINKDWT